MPTKDLNQLIHGIEYPGVQVLGANFNLNPGFSGTAKANITFSGAVSTTVGDVITQTPAANIALNFSYPITANVGMFITQSSSGANATIYGIELASGSPDNVVESTFVYVIKNNNHNFTANGNIAINTVAQIKPIYTTDSITGVITWANVGIKPIQENIGTSTVVEIPVAIPSATITKVWSSSTVSAIVSSSADFVDYSNVKINNVLTSVYPAGITYITQDATAFDGTVFDPVEYDSDGVALLSSKALDTIIQSSYSDSLLGTRPEDIDVDGGQYIDTYSSHAPEELIPGITFDTLDMKIFTSNVSYLDLDNNPVVSTLGYRVFQSMSGNISYLRIADEFTTTLVNDLLLTDTEMVVGDASILAAPSTGYGRPGVLYINGERITYYRSYVHEVQPWVSGGIYNADTVLSYDGNNYITTQSISSNTFDYANVAVKLDNINVLTRLRRGTEGTAAATIHVKGQTVVGGSQRQIIPGTVTGNVTLLADLDVTVGNTYVRTIPAGTVLQTSNIWLNPGDGITNVTDGTGFSGATTIPIKFLKGFPSEDTANLATLPTDTISSEEGIPMTTEASVVIIKE
jgi:hypothetical protein